VKLIVNGEEKKVAERLEAVLRESHPEGRGMLWGRGQSLTAR